MPQDFEGIFEHYSALCMKELKGIAKSLKSTSKLLAWKTVKAIVPGLMTEF